MSWPLLIVGALVGCGAGEAQDVPEPSTSVSPEPTPSSPDTAQTTSDETGSTTPVSDEVLILASEEISPLEQPLQGLAFHTLVAGLDQAGHSSTESPFCTQQMEPAAIPDAFGDLYSRLDVCYVDAAFDVQIRGSLDVGPSLAWSIGSDEVALRRDQFAPGQLLYVFDPWRDVVVGDEVGAELVIDGHPTGVHVPERFVLEPEVWVDILAEASGVLDLRWEPVADAEAVIVVGVRLYESADAATYVYCALVDDGRAVVDVGLGSLWGIELTIGRLDSGVTEHPTYGPLHVSAERHVRGVAYDIDPEIQ